MRQNFLSLFDCKFLPAHNGINQIDIKFLFAALKSLIVFKCVIFSVWLKPNEIQVAEEGMANGI